MRTHSEYISTDIHAYLAEGNSESLVEEINHAIRKQLGVTIRGNPDVIRIIKDEVVIDDARYISEFQSRKSLDGNESKKVILVSCRSITTEAQNALLKVIEEPTAGTYFFVIVPAERILLPTLRSRFFSITRGSFAQGDDSSVDVFLSTTVDKRLKLIETIVKNKDRASAHIFLDSVLTRLYKGGVEENTNSNYNALMEIVQAKRYLASRGASVKLLLEHIAMITPRQDLV